MSESMKSTASLSLDDLVRTPPGPGSWAGRSIMIRHAADGKVMATSRGLVAVGATEGAALQELARLVKAAERSAQERPATSVPVAATVG
jgi:hypothetical protein